MPQATPYPSGRFKPLFDGEASNDVDSIQAPPIGLMPKRIWDEKRCEAILGAIEKYKQAGKQIPTEWIIELASLEHCIRLNVKWSVDVEST